MNVGKEWEIPLRQPQKNCQELFLGVVALKTLIQKNNYMRDMGLFPRYCHICLWIKNIFDRTLAIDLPFQTFVLGLLLEFIDLLYHCFLQNLFPRRVNHRFSHLMCTLLYSSGWMTKLPAQSHRKASSFSKLELALEK